jgi:TRAP-type uncharacterized transport system substrate-binding protein
MAAGLSLQGALALAAVELKIVTASARGTYIQIGRDIASIVAPSADIELDVLPSAGSAENVRRLRYEPGVKFAIVQSDVYQRFSIRLRVETRKRTNHPAASRHYAALQ